MRDLPWVLRGSWHQCMPVLKHKLASAENNRK